MPFVNTYYLSGFEPLSRELLVFKLVRTSETEVANVALMLGIDEYSFFPWTLEDSANYSVSTKIGAGISLMELATVSTT